MRKERDAKTKIELPSILEEDHKEIDKFLSKINSTIAEIRKSEEKKYSILSLVLNCFYENRSLFLPKKTILDYIHQDILKNKGKMIVSFVSNGTNNMGIINENNYIKKTYNILAKNKCLEQGRNNCISIDMNFTQTHKNLLYRNLFGSDEYAKQKIRKLKRPKINKKGEIKKKIIKKVEEDDFEIEILENAQEEAENTEVKEENFKSINEKDSKNNTNIININKNELFHKNSNILNNISKNNNANISQKKPDSLYLNKKRKTEKIDKLINIEKEENNIDKKNPDFYHGIDDKFPDNNNSNMIIEKKE